VISRRTFLGTASAALLPATGSTVGAVTVTTGIEYPRIISRSTSVPSRSLSASGLWSSVFWKSLSG
jgi:hypothetical protein